MRWKSQKKIIERDKKRERYLTKKGIVSDGQGVEGRDERYFPFIIREFILSFTSIFFSLLVTPPPPHYWFFYLISLSSLCVSLTLFFAYLSFSFSYSLSFSLSLHISLSICLSFSEVCRKSNNLFL